MAVLKSLFLIFFCICVVICTSINHKFIGRSMRPESVALEIEYLGSCNQFDSKVVPTIMVSNVTGGRCLPFNETDFTDPNDLTADYFCTDFGDRSIVHFVEVYSVNDSTPVTPFIISLIPDVPFRSSLRPVIQPDCEKSYSVCTEGNSVVSSCTPNPVVLKKGFVLSKERIYLCSSKCIDGKKKILK